MAITRSLVEGPRIYQTQSIELQPLTDSDPVRYDAHGKVWIKEEIALEGARLGPYDRAFDFETTREPLKGLVPLEQRLTANTDRLTVLAFDDQLVEQAMNALTKIANTTATDNAEAIIDYRGHLARVYRPMAETLIERGWSDALIFTPKNGGIFVREVFEAAGISADNFFDYRLSRVQKKDDGLMIGATFGENNPKIKDYRRFVFADDCIASDISSFATLEILKEQLEEAGVPLSEVEIMITVSIANQRAIESILSPEMLEHFGFKNIKAVVGTLAYQTNSHFYLLTPNEDREEMAVGDMGARTQLIAA
jgi:hypothetical protein